MRHISRRTAGALALTCSILVLVAGTAGAVIKNTTIHDIRLLNGIVLNDTVSVDSVVVIGVDVKPGTYGIYLEERGGGAWSGILFYMSGTFPGYSNTADAVAVGDLVKIPRGVYTEFASGAGSLSEINLSLGVKPIKLGTTTPPAAQVLPVDSLKVNYPGSERWEGVLVRTDSVVVTSTDGFRNWPFHRFVGPAPGRVDSLVGYEKMISGQVVPSVGDQLRSVTGVLDWANSTRKIAPRGDADIVFISPQPAPVPLMGYSTAENKIKVKFNVTLDVTTAQNTANYSLNTLTPITLAVYDAPSKSVTLTTSSNLVPNATTPHVLTVQNVRNTQNVIMTGPATVTFIGGICTIPFVQTPKGGAGADTSRVVGLRVSFRGICTQETGVDLSSSIGGVYLQQRGATEYAGIFVYGAPVTPARGDSVFVAGIVTEFGVGPETEITPVAEMAIVPPPPLLITTVIPMLPIAVTAADISGSNLTQAEKYESSLVKISGVQSVTTATFGSPFTVVSGPDSVHIGDLAIDEGTYAPWKGDMLDIIGITRFAGSNPPRRLEPRNWNEPPTGDLHVISKGNVSDAPPIAYRTRLLQNQPNPFNPTTTIQFEMARAGQARVAVYDVRGKLVATLFEGVAGAGRHPVVWNGRTSKGDAAGTGIYFYRLVTDELTQTLKMALIK